MAMVLGDKHVPNLRGELIQPGDEQYEAARQVYNAMIDRHPTYVARCADVADVIACVQFARSRGMDLAIRGGGHNGGGLGVCDGFVIDFCRMRGVRVDPAARTVRVEAGCTWGDVDHATHPFGLAAVSGIISTTGVAGLTLGGGHGHLTRKYGLTIDNLLSADAVLADGRFLTASETENQDLFWAIRGGGGNFGVITSFEFRLHAVDTVMAGPTLWDLDQAAGALRVYRDFINEAPDDVNGFFTFMVVPPVPDFPEHLHGRTTAGIFWCCTGEQSGLEKALEPVRGHGKPVFDHVGRMPYPALQSAFDGLYPPGMQWYWRGDFVKEIPEEAVDLHVQHGSRLPSPFSTMHLYPLSGAPQRTGRSDMAFSYRDANWSAVIVGVDPDPANAGRITRWTKEYWDALHPYSLGGAYVNFLMDEGQERVQATYRDNYARLAAIKKKYDPDNFFHLNQNIHPAG
jgi:FAD/FMN-containing dehydrogenase